MSLASGAAPRTYTVRAHNTSTSSENRIHSDDVAAQFGFRGGLVPGVAVYAYMTRPVVEAWGREWVERGTINARFVQPFYEGDDVVVSATPTRGGDGGEALELTASREAESCATGAATLPPAGLGTPDPGDYPAPPTPAPDARPPATAEVLGSLDALALPPSTFVAEKAQAYLHGIADDHPLYRPLDGTGGVAHPGYLIRAANTVLSANVRLGPWIHVSTATVHFRAVVDGDVLSTRARVTDLFERKGHKFVTLDVIVLAGDAPALRATHTAIYEIAPRQ